MMCYPGALPHTTLAMAGGGDSGDLLHELLRYTRKNFWFKSSHNMLKNIKNTVVNNSGNTLG